jgi:predicted alpha/beta-fold hydrolase
MPVLESEFNPPQFIKNGHIQTLYPCLFRKVKNVDGEHQRLQTRDGDFLDIRWAKNQSDSVVIFTHGLEGNKNAYYIQGMAKHLQEQGHFDFVFWNQRGCSEELNQMPHFYHASLIEDLEEVIFFALKNGQYKKVYLAGFSLGGNLNLKYLGTRGRDVPTELAGAIMFSSPVHLETAAHQLFSVKFGRLYVEYFLSTMRKKVIAKTLKQNLDLYCIDSVRKTKSFIEFDEIVTAPMTGHSSAQEYYRNASAFYDLENIKVPTLLVQSKDDPFLSKECYPEAAAKKNPYLYLEVTPTGGHVGFFNIREKIQYWGDLRANRFFSDVA